MKVHYLEIVSNDVGAVCKAYEKSHGVRFSDPDAIPGGARTCIMNTPSGNFETEPADKVNWLGHENHCGCSGAG